MTTEKKKSPTSKTKLVSCIHGLTWVTCAICHEKTLEDVQTEKKFIQQSHEERLSFDYQESKDLEKLEQDRDYDLDDMSVS